MDFCRDILGRRRVINDEIRAYEYAGYSLDDLAIIATSVPSAKEELDFRIGKISAIYVHRACKKYTYLNFDDTYAFVMSQCGNILKKFDPKRGCFRNFLGKAILLNVKAYYSKKAIQFQREREMLGIRVQSLADERFSDVSAQEHQENLILKTDIAQFLQTLSNADREIFVMYMNHFTYRQISKVTNIPLATISYRIHLLLEQLAIRENENENKLKKDIEKKILVFDEIAKEK